MFPVQKILYSEENKISVEPIANINKSRTQKTDVAAVHTHSQRSVEIG